MEDRLVVKRKKEIRCQHDKGFLFWKIYNNRITKNKAEKGTLPNIRSVLLGLKAIKLAMCLLGYLKVKSTSVFYRKRTGPPEQVVLFYKVLWEFWLLLFKGDY